MSEEDISRSQSLTNIDATCIETSPLNRLTGDNDHFIFSGRQFLTSLGQQESKETDTNWQKTVPTNIIKSDKKSDKRPQGLDHQIGEFISQGKINEQVFQPQKADTDSVKKNETSSKISEPEMSSAKDDDSRNLSKKVEIDFDHLKGTPENSTPTNKDGISPDLSESGIKKSQSPDKSTKSDVKITRFAKLGGQLKSRSSSQFHGFGASKTFSRSFDSEIKNYDHHRAINTEYQDNDHKGSFCHLNLISSESDIKTLAAQQSPTSQTTDQQTIDETKRLSLCDQPGDKSDLTVQLSLKNKHLLKTGYQISREIFTRKKTSPQFNLSSSRKKADFLTESVELSRHFKKKEQVQQKDRPSPHLKNDVKPGSVKVKTVKP